jgi:hypothetical protein
MNEDHQWTLLRSCLDEGNSMTGGGHSTPGKKLSANKVIDHGCCFLGSIFADRISASAVRWAAKFAGLTGRGGNFDWLSPNGVEKNPCKSRMVPVSALASSLLILRTFSVCRRQDET